VYVVYLRNPRGDGKAGYYVGMTGLSPEQRFQNHKNGRKAARIVKKHG
jgi:predicted GIY-YIG superfamily endonuclease